MKRTRLFLILGSIVLLGVSCSSDPYYSSRDPYVLNSRETNVKGGSMAGRLIGASTGLGGLGGAAVGGVLGGVLSDTANSANSR